MEWREEEERDEELLDVLRKKKEGAPFRKEPWSARDFLEYLQRGFVFVEGEEASFHHRPSSVFGGRRTDPEPVRMARGSGGAVLPPGARRQWQALGGEFLSCWVSPEGPYG